MHGAQAHKMLPITQYRKQIEETC
uniref:Uncharacterized protein n=1 Tax=Rhizophora mucronata TaxID=61149 RepID=A0A2P2P406_RHIMU